MEARWNRKLRRGKDGCPWPGHPASMPEDWCHWNYRVCFTERTCRMWGACNGLWPQVDTADTLYLSACMHHLDPSRKEWLNLPISHFNLHPFRLSIGHDVHDRILRSGWTTPFPSSLSQYDEKLNNLLIETAFSNFFKSNATDNDCARAREHLLSISLPKDLYCPRELLRPSHRNGPQYALWSINGPATSDNPRELSVRSGLRAAALTSAVQASSNSYEVSKLEDAVTSKAGKPLARALPASKAGINGSTSPNTLVKPCHHGIENLARPCWLNSIIQFLHMIEPLRQGICLFNNNGIKGSSRVDRARHDMISALKEVFEALNSHNDQALRSDLLMTRLTILRRTLEGSKENPGPL